MIDRYFRHLMVLAALVAAACGLRAQSIDVSIGTPFIRALMLTTTDVTRGGRFDIDAGSFLGGDRFLGLLNSHLVFRVTTGGHEYYYTNSIDLDGPRVGDTVLPFRSYDSLYASEDTIAVGWKGLAGGYSVTQRLIIESVRRPYSRGGDVLIEFSYTRAAGVTEPAELGIVLMLDVANESSELKAHYRNDTLAILTARGYFPPDRPGRLFQGIDSIPAFYQAGYFLADPPLDKVFPIHRVTGVSHNGAPLTPPDLLAIGPFSHLRALSWNVTPADVAGNLGDPATILRWGGLQGSGTIRTAYGANDREENDMFHCRDSALFVDLKTARVVTTGRDSLFDATVWITNTSAEARSLTMSLQDPVGSPSAAGRIALDPSTPAEQPVSLAARETRMLRWRLRALGTVRDSIVHVPLDFRFRYGAGPARAFALPCSPIVTLRREGAIDPLHRDTIAPALGLQQMAYDTAGIVHYGSFDRHKILYYLEYLDDTGLDTVYAPSATIENAAVSIAIEKGMGCDPRRDATIRIVQIDSLRPMSVLLVARDCAGNDTSVVATLPAREYRIDTLAPSIIRYDSSARAWFVSVSDRHGEYRYDTGIDTIVAERAENFVLQQNDFTRCDKTVEPHIVARVVNPNRDGMLEMVAFDCRGNTRRDTIFYRATSSVPAASDLRRGAMSVSVEPQPLARSRERVLRVIATGAGAGEAHGELVTADGRVVARFDLEPSASGELRAAMKLPRDLPAGLYLVRVAGSGGSASAKVVVIE